jgi:riboflavin biosynthesis pyrimidine reductase
VTFIPAPLELLYEAPGLAAFNLPEELRHDYGGPLGFEAPRLYANFVASADGVTAIPSIPQSNKLIAGGSASDRFVMGLLRACADALVIGSGTLNASPGGRWTPEQAYPAAADAFADLRARLDRPPTLELVVLTARGSIDPSHPALAAGAVVLTTDLAADKLERQLPATATVIPVSTGPGVEVRAALELLRNRGHRVILSEGGPHLLGAMLEARLVDELFLTISPLLVGRTGVDERLALVEGADLVADGPVEAKLLSLRRDGGHLFLRYELSSDG